jgi:hypothetical protein
VPTFRFGFKKSGKIGHATSEQQAIIEKLQAGEITPEEAAKQLGGQAHVFEFGTKPKGDEEGGEEDSEPPGSEAMPAADPRLVRRLHALLAAVTAVLAVAVALGGATAHDHALTSLVFAFLSLLLFGALAAGTGLGGPPRGTVLATVPLLGAGVVLDWGFLTAVFGGWSIYYPGLIVIGLAVSVLLVGLLVSFAAPRTSATLDDLTRRGR